MDSGRKNRVHFRAPTRLIEQAEALATVLETNRTTVLTTALREYLRDATHDDEINQEIAGAYYDDRISFEQLQNLVGHDAAANFRVLKAQLDTEFIDTVAEEYDP